MPEYTIPLTAEERECLASVLEGRLRGTGAEFRHARMPEDRGIVQVEEQTIRGLLAKLGRSAASRKEQETPVSRRPFVVLGQSAFGNVYGWSNVAAHANAATKAAAEQESAPTKLNALVDSKELFTPGLMTLRVVADGWKLPHFEAGQYTVLGLPPEAPRCALSVPETTPSKPDKLIRRAYSIASSSLTREYLDFYIRLVSSGALTPRLFALQPGDPLWLSPKMTGLFTLDRVANDRDIVMVATGTGLAPYMSMLTSHLECNAPQRVAVLHGAQHSWDLGYRSELMAFEHLCKNFTYLPTISRPEGEPGGWNGHVGWVQQLWRSGRLEEAWGARPTPDDSDVFVCGYPGMVDEMVGLLEKEGFREQTPRQPGQIHVERY